MVTSMGNPETERFITIEEYLDGETRSEVRHEYFGGQVYAMSGGSEAHNLICGNLYAAIRQHLRGKPCKVFIADMKLRLNIAEDAVFYYPDLLVTCDPSDREPYFKTKPVVLVEVLSPSTERLDRREKFLSYIALPTLKEYVMIDQAKQAVTRFRQESAWKPEHLAGGDALALPSIGFEQSLAAIYEDVFEEANAVQHNGAALRFETTSGARLDYHFIADDAINITHTFVPDHLRGQGLAAQLMDAVIGYTVKSGLNVHASCDYAEAYLKRKGIQG